IISGAKKDELIAADPRSAEIIKPILRGRDIKRYKAEFADLWLIATHNGYTDSLGNKIPRIEISDYPAIKKHLDGYWDKIEKRADQGSTPYNLRNCGYMEEFEKEKVVWGNLALSSQFALADKGSFVNAPSPIFTPANRYILSVLNSKLGDYYIRSLGVTRNGGYFEYKPMFVEKLPIPIAPKEQQILFERVCERILTLKQNNLETQDLESQIDLMVYKLYELSYAEAKLIDPDLDSVFASFGLSAQDFERMTMEQLAKMELK
ncbi:MAG: TaqI-like C-terminal specificity domain-containing protein, partial [Candidatus Cloacimonetes bacterium]|nr:TaqI-like C-terminal specificity domain-containing protein [Candidatus Cloacimonadota bacterium]